MPYIIITFPKYHQPQIQNAMVFVTGAIDELVLQQVFLHRSHIYGYFCAARVLWC